MTVNVTTIKWGTKYPPHYVNRLYGGVSRNLARDFRFVCFTDDAEGIRPEVEIYPLPPVNLEATGGFRNGKKQGLFQSGIGDFEGPCLYFDLDVIVVGSIDCLFDYLPGKLCICKEWLAPNQILLHKLKNKPVGGNSSVFRFEANSLQFIIDRMDEQPDLPRKFQMEQRWFTFVAGDLMNWWPTKWVKSFKHRRPVYPLSFLFPPRLPKDCRVMVFNGPLQPADAVTGRIARSPRQVCRPAKWAAQHWTE